MSLLTKLQEDMKAAMKTGQKDRLLVIRMLLNEVKNIDLNPQKPTEEQAVAAYAKKLKKGIEEYEKLGKAPETEKLKWELEIAESYLPKKASVADTEAIVDQFLSQNSFTEKQIGQAMGMLMKAHGGQIDAGAANAILRKKLAGKQA